MPLPYVTTTELAIPESWFNSDGLAALLLQGGRYGGDWSINVGTFPPRDDVDIHGGVETSSPQAQELSSDSRYPYLALESGFVWLKEQAEVRNWRLVHWECLNEQFEAESRPYFCAAWALVANENFVPAPTVTYVDQQTLDQVMGYSTIPG